MNKQETWNKLIDLNLVEGEIPEGEWDLIGADLSYVDLNGANFIGANLSGANLIGTNLSGADLSSVDFIRANLCGANLSGVNLIGADLSEADLSGADLGFANLGGANLSDANLSDADLRGAIIYDASFSGANLSRANLSGADLREADLFRAILSRADLSEVTLGKCNLNGADLFEVNLSGTDLREADIRRADMRYANLSNANLRKANLCGVNLKGSNLGDADLKGAKIIDVNFNLSNLSGAEITGSTYWGVSTAGWKIDGIKAKHVYFCRDDEKEKNKYKKEFQEGQFEALYRSLPTVELIFTEGLSPTNLFMLTALIEEIKRQNPDYGIRMADISKNEFETKIGIKTNKDEFLDKVGQLINEAVNQAMQGMSFDTIVPHLVKMLPENTIRTLAETQQKQPSPIIITLNKCNIQLTKADGSMLGTISQNNSIQYIENIIVKNYEAHRKELDRLFKELKDTFGEYEASMRNEMKEATDRMIEAIKNGKDKETIQNHWDNFKDRINLTGSAVTIATAVSNVPIASAASIALKIGSLLGLT